MTPIDLKGKHFGRLVVISYEPSSKGTGHAWWICKCICGNTTIVRANHLKDGSTVSCGCYAKQKSRELLSKYANSRKHKGAGNPQWKGKKAGLASIHIWLNRHYVKLNCAKCQKEKNLDWALLKGKEYDHNRNNFIVLCRSCHLLYDYTLERKKKISIKMKKYHAN